MPIYRRGDRWWIDFRVRGRRYRELSGHSREVAARYLLKRRAEVEAGLLAPRIQSVTLREWAPTFMEWSQGRKASWKRDETSLGHLLPALGALRLDELTPQVIEKYQRERLKSTTRFGGPPKPATINREVACLKKMLTLAARDKVIGDTPARGVEMLREDNERSRTLTPAEMGKILDASPGWLRPIVALAYETAMRQSEVTLLRWDQVDVEAGFVRLESRATKGRSARSVPLSDAAIAILEARPKPTDPAARVFPDVRPDAVSKGFAEACKETGVAGATFHDLRHTAVTRWADLGHDQKLIMTATGHKTDSMFRRYRAATERHLRALVMDTPAVTPRRPKRKKPSK